MAPDYLKVCECLRLQFNCEFFVCCLISFVAFEYMLKRASCLGKNDITAVVGSVDSLVLYVVVYVILSNCLALLYQPILVLHSSFFTLSLGCVHSGNLFCHTYIPF